MDKSQVLAAVLLNILGLLTHGLVQAYSPGCTFSQYLALNTNYYINNTQYPYYYGPNTDCLWVGTSVAGSLITINCEEITIPATTGCSGDQFRVSLTGDTTFSDAKVYCGSGTLSLQSTTNRVAIELLAASNSAGGRFFCTLRAEPVSTCDCGIKRATRIVGGVLSGVNEYTMMAGVVDRDVGVVCGGTIISDQHVLTAAHCPRLIPDYSKMAVLVGDWNTSTGADTNAAALYTVQSVIVHSGFNEILQTNDIAILKTSTKIIFSLYVGPACLPFRYVNANFTGQIATYTGWGQLFFNGPSSNTLYKVDVSIISNYQCQQVYTQQQITSGQLCTFTKGKDACQGDSGGPLFWMDYSTSRVQLLGVVSAGYACGIKPGIDTRVTQYLNWIQTMTPGVSYCIK